MAEPDDKLRRLEDPIARKKRKLEEALARKKARSGTSEDSLGSADLLSSDATVSGSSDATTSSPAATPGPTATPGPVATPGPTATPGPATTPGPTATPSPATTPGPAASPSPAAASAPTPGSAAASGPAASSAIAIACPKCGNKAQVPSAYQGQLVKCAGCAAALRIGPTGATLAPPPQPAAGPPASSGADEGPPLPLLVGAAVVGLILIVLVVGRLSSDGEPDPSPSPTQVAVSPTATPSVAPSAEPSVTPAPSVAPSPSVTPSVTPTASVRPSSTPTPTETAPVAPSPSPEPTPTETAPPTVCQVLGQVAITSRGTLVPVPNHRLRVVGNPDALMAALPGHEAAYDAAVQEGLRRLYALDPLALEPTEYTEQASSLIRRMRLEVNELVRSLRAIIAKHTVEQVITDGQGRFGLVLDPGRYVILSDETFPADGGDHTAFAEMTFKAGTESFRLSDAQLDKVPLLTERALD